MTVPKRIGIVGGGQLARMLLEASDRLNIPCHVYVQNKNDSTTFVARMPDVCKMGALNDPAALAAFFAPLEWITFENEFLDIQIFKDALARAHSAHKNVIPKLSHLAETQDKLRQKQLFQNLGIPTAEFQILDSEEALANWLTAHCGGWGEAILKWSRFGYDGKGNLRVRDGDPLPPVIEFFRNGNLRGAQVFAERMIPFRREIAIQATYSAGAFVTFPVVVSEQKNSICHRVWGPAQAWGVAATTESYLGTFAEDLARKFGLEGTFAVEAFELEGGKILVNEIAPRVHNTGHATQSVCDHSQFDLHVRAVAGLPIPVPQLKAPYFAMLNILGPETPAALSRLGSLFSAGTSNTPVEDLTPRVGMPSFPQVNVTVTWYDKEPRAGRKLGHINFWSDEQNELKLALHQWEDWIYHA